MGMANHAVIVEWEREDEILLICQRCGEEIARASALSDLPFNIIMRSEKAHVCAGRI